LHNLLICYIKVKVFIDRIVRGSYSLEEANMFLEVATFAFCVCLAVVADIFFAKPRRVDYYVISGILLIAYGVIEAFLLIWGTPHTALAEAERVAMALAPVGIWLIGYFMGPLPSVEAIANRASEQVE
jgi:hypothetical protein